MASTLPTLSTRTLPTTLVLHQQSCCPTMDIAALSNPTNATGNASLQLYRLSGGSSSLPGDGGGAAASAAAVSAASVLSRGAQSGSRAWEAIIDSKAVVVPLDPAAMTAGTTAAANASAAGSAPAATTYIQPRAAESLVWHPDGHTLAFASTPSTFMLHSVHDGKPTLPHSPLSSFIPSDHAIYLLSWESTLPSDKPLVKPEINAQSIEEALPKLSEVKKLHDKGPVKTGTFVNPFTAAGMMAKPYVPAVPFQLGPFPTLPRPSLPLPESVLDENEHDDSDQAPSDEDELLNSIAGVAKTENPTLLMLYDVADGQLHFMLEGAISLGSFSLGGEGVDVISACIAGTSGLAKTAFNPARPALHISLLISVQHAGSATFKSYPRSIVDALTASAQHIASSSDHAQPSPSTVMHLSLEIPNFPSTEINLLARATTSVRKLLALAYEAFDEARKGWEEARALGKRWLSRLEDESHNLKPELQLLTLLLTGRPSNTNMHEYLASKNTERNTENWETFHLKVAARLRDTAYQTLNPICERLILWLSQMRGWALWQDRFGHLGLDLQGIEDCITLVQLLMMRSHALEEIALQEETGFREFCGWLKSDMERLVSLDGNATARSGPKHDVYGVMAYIRTRLTHNPLDEIVVVELQEIADRYTSCLDHWLRKKAELDAELCVDENSEQTLAETMKTVERNFAALGLSMDDEDDDDSIPEKEGQGEREENEVQLGSDGLYTSGFTITEPIQPAQPTGGGRRKSTASQQQSITIIPTELPISFLLAQLTCRLDALFNQSFSTIGPRTQIAGVEALFTWRPPDLEEDDAMATLGLARDPTKITSRLLKETEHPEPSTSFLYIACETPRGSLMVPSNEESAFWILANSPLGLAGIAYGLYTESGQTFEIMDIEFFDDLEVALLLRHRERQASGGRFSLGLVNYREQDLQQLGEKGLQVDSMPHPLPPIPFSRLHGFDSAFEPLQFSLNGRKGRRIATILGNSGKILEVLDMDPEADEEEPEEGDSQIDVDL